MVEGGDMFELYERIDNMGLILNNLSHIDFELSSANPSPMRIAKESHQLLLRTMVEALRGTANLSITGRPSKERKRWYHYGDGQWKSIHKIEVAGCQKAWRYSDPIIETPPTNEPQEDKKVNKSESDSFLLGFYDLLAMIQAPCFMIRFVHSRIVELSTEDMQCLEWLHEEVRNELEHFIPKLLLASPEDCLNSAEICIKTTSKLLFESGNIMLGPPNDLKDKLINLLKKIHQFTQNIRS
jgi:hypothetical protein